MRLLSSLLVCSSALFLTGCLTIMQPPVHACDKPNENTLRLQGPVNERMAQCAREKMDSSISIVEVSSFGGDTRLGREIGDLIAARPRTVVILDECLSSCGNYFIATAKTVELRDGAIIGLHGTPDPRLMKTGRDLAELAWQKDLSHGRLSALDIPQLRKQRQSYEAAELADEERFAKQFGVPLGWRFFREEEDSKQAFTQYLTGKQGYNLSEKAGMVAVEEDMLRSCLPHVEFSNVETTSLIVENGGKRLREAKALGVQFSGTVKCKPDTGQYRSADR